MPLSVALERARAIGRAILRARLEAGVAASELAAAVGVDETTILRVERGDKFMRIARLYQVAMALGVPLDHLVGGR